MGAPTVKERRRHCWPGKSSTGDGEDCGSSRKKKRKKEKKVGGSVTCGQQQSLAVVVMSYILYASSRLWHKLHPHFSIDRVFPQQLRERDEKASLVWLSRAVRIICSLGSSPCESGYDEQRRGTLGVVNSSFS